MCSLYVKRIRYNTLTKKRQGRNHIDKYRIQQFSSKRLILRMEFLMLSLMLYPPNKFSDKHVKNKIKTKNSQGIKS
jgi:hypothetical protein